MFYINVDSDLVICDKQDFLQSFCYFLFDFINLFESRIYLFHLCSFYNSLFYILAIHFILQIDHDKS